MTRFIGWITQQPPQFHHQPRGSSVCMFVYVCGTCSQAAVTVQCTGVHNNNGVANSPKLSSAYRYIFLLNCKKESSEREGIGVTISVNNQTITTMASLKAFDQSSDYRYLLKEQHIRRDDRRRWCFRGINLSIYTQCIFCTRSIVCKIIRQNGGGGKAADGINISAGPHCPTFNANYNYR